MCSSDRTSSDDRLVRFYGQWTSAEKRAVRSAIEAVEPILSSEPPRDANFTTLWQASIPRSRSSGKRFTVYRMGHPHVLCASTLVQICQQIQALAASAHGALETNSTNGLAAGRSSDDTDPVGDITARLLLVARGQGQGSAMANAPRSLLPQSVSRMSSCFAFTARDVLKSDAEGELDLRRSHDALDALAQQKAFEAADGILIDLRSTTHPLSAMRLFELVAHIARMEREGRHRKIAVVIAAESEIDRAEFAARCARQQISNIRSFEDSKLARAWLDPHAYMEEKSDV